ncbi:MAG: phosphate butyryltransferase [FCB group bacterium]|nr:phosphate butyryltransferase [FCB group bacterium]
MTFENNFTIPEIHSFEQIVAKAETIVNASGKPKTALVVPTGLDALKAFAMAMDKNIIEPYLIGDEVYVRAKAEQNEINLEKAKFINIIEPDSAVLTASKMAIEGELDLIVKGHIPTVPFLKTLFREKDFFNKKDNFVSHVAVIKPKLYQKLLLLTDAAINIAPDLKGKLSLINNAVKVAKVVGIGMPRVALLAAVEVVYPQMPVTMDAAIISKMAERRQIKDAYVDGPLSFDVAVDMIAAHSKGIKNSPVAGQADILIAPNLETANGVYKAMTLFGKVQIGGIVYGGKVPIVLSSRSDSMENQFYAIVLGVLVACSR